MLRLLVFLTLITCYLIFFTKAFTLTAYIGAVSLITFAAFGADKFCAERNLRRIPEDALLFLACIGGTPGAFSAQLVLHHKTIKPYFNRALAVISIFQLILIVSIGSIVMKCFK